MNLLHFLLIFSFISYISCKGSCNSQRTCGLCIGHAEEECVWCSEDKNVTIRCQPILYNETDINWCKKEYITQSKTEKWLKQDNNFTDTVQLRPQEIIIKARPGKDMNFQISYKPAKDFPLDVYFLMDYTYTMMKHVEMLRKQSLQIYESLKNMTQNVRLGVGSFIEKPGLPYSDIYVSVKNIVPAYVFKNHLSLTDNMTAFERQIQEPKFGSNYDDAEAGLDALMQVMKCTEKLGWRKDTKRIIVLVTDNTYHSAGDGKMVGAFKPNNMKCNLKDDEYNKEDSLKYDYPSVSQINKAASDGNFLIIFAALKYMENVYKSLSNQIEASSYAELKEKSNIMEIIQNEYKKSVSAVKIGHDASSSSFQVTIDQKCSNETNKNQNSTSAEASRNCESTPENPIVQIPVTIRSIKCLDSKQSQVVVTFDAKNGIADKVKVKFEVDCQCACEKNKKNDKSSEKCNNKGFIQCGACKCNKDWGGDTCEVNCSDDTSMELEVKCNQKQFKGALKCNGHGTCECGKCLCTDGFTGEFCEFGPDSCDAGSNGLVCSGTSHGICQYGNCTCKDEWTGKACDCPKEEKSLKLCTGPFSKKTCSGNGHCECGKCICNSKNTEEMYSGAFCDFCKDCSIERCRELEGYAKCNQNKTKQICDEEFDLTTDINLDVTVANKSKLVETREWITGTQCRTELDDGTFLVFKYNVYTKTNDEDTESGKMLLMIQKEVEIPPKVDMYVPIASVIAAILLIGLLTIVFWKLLVEWYDKREYNKFCTEAESQGYDVTQNVLYEPPTQTFVNPACDQSS